MKQEGGQRWDAERYARHARFVSDLGRPALAWLAPRPGERVLDLGCGDGALTQALVEAGCEVVGVDASADMVAAARRRGLDVRVADARALEFESEFDAVFSNAALHWMGPLEPVLAGVRHALKPGGRFVGEFGGRGNCAAVVTALENTLAARGSAFQNPWRFPDEHEFTAQLRDAGFEVRRMELFPRPTPLPGGLEAWLATFAQPFTAALPGDARPAFFAEVADSLRGALQDEAGAWRVDYVRLRFEARSGVD